MPAFSLYGELKIDTQQFERALHDAEVSLDQTTKKATDLEKRARSLGQTSATSARGVEKINDAIRQQKQRLLDAAGAFEKGDISAKRFASVVSQTENRVAALNSRLKDQSARLSDLPGRWSKVSSTLRQTASEFTSVAGWVGAATSAVGLFSIRAANNIENARNKFTALEGSVGKANERIQKLLDLSRKSPGVSFDEALQSFGQLKVLGTVGDASINKMIQGLGRLRLAFDSSMGSTSDFLLNMQQLFDQGFEAQDWKQAIGRVQIFAQLVKQAFGTDDPQKLKELRDSGKLTFESWITGFADAANSDTRLASLNETWSTKLNKALTEVNFAAAPLGDAILAAIKPEFDRAIEGLKSGNYAEIGNAIGVSIGKAIGTGIQGALSSESALGGGQFGSSLGEGILSGFGSTDSSAVVQTFFNKLQFEIRAGIVDLVALIESGSIIGGAFKLTDSIVESLGFTVDASNSLQKRTESFFRSTREDLKAEFERNSVTILQASKASFDKIANDTGATEAARATAQRQSAAIAEQITAAQGRLNEAIQQSTVEASKRLGSSILATEPTVSGAMTQMVATAASKATAAATTAGTNIGQGFANGIRSQLRTVQNAMTQLTEIGIIQPPKNILDSHSPSKVFVGIGKDVVQGFIDGISSLEASAQRAMADLVDVRKIKGAKFGKADAPGLELLGSLSNELARLNAVTKVQQTLLDLSAGKYGKVSAQIRNFNLAVAEEIDRQNSAKEGLSQFNELWDEYITKTLPVKTATEQINAALADPKVIEGMKSFNAEMRTRIESMLRLGGIMRDTEDLTPGLGRPEDVGGGVGLATDEDIIPPPPPLAPYNAFFGHIHESLDRMRADVQDSSGILGDSIGGALEDIGNVFASSVARWDGTVSGFFTSVAQGFGQMAKQIVADLVRIAIYQAVLKLIGAFAGGAGGGGGGGDLGGSFDSIATFGGLATGGLVEGPGTSTSDSILARLSNGEFVMNARSVKSLGTGFLSSLNSIGTPALASGGMASPSWSPSAKPIGGNTYNIHNHFHANENGAFSKPSAEQAARRSAHFIQRTAERSNE